MNKLLRYTQFIKESKEFKHYLPTYEDCIEMCSKDESAFYESKFMLDGYSVSVFNYRLAQYKDFVIPIENKPEVKAYEMRGLTFVFNKDGSLFNRFLLLEKFFNLNQVPESMYSIVKNYKIKFINNKEDGSIASYIKLPNGEVIGKSKMGFDNEQANGINRIYRTRTDVKEFVDWCLDNDVTAIFEYVSPANRIVLRYLEEDLILLRLRNNSTGKHLNIKDHLDKIGTIRIAPFEDDDKDLDSLIEVTATQVDKEGVIVQTEDEYGKDFFFKLKTPWYMSLHGLLTDDIYREHIIIGYILDDKIDDVLGQIPVEQIETRERIEKIIKIIKEQIDIKVKDIEKSYQKFLDMESNRKDYAILYNKKDINFGYVMSLDKGRDIYDLAKEYIREKTKRLLMAREWLKRIDPTLFFQEPDPKNEDN
jgi:T4 RnlA family RNA ligase